MTPFHFTFCGLLAAAVIGFMFWQRKENLPEEHLAFMDIQRFILRLETDYDMNKAYKMIQWFISRYGQTPNATRLQMQLQRKQLNIPELN